jgi:uncharacterized protein YdaL
MMFKRSVSLLLAAVLLTCLFTAYGADAAESDSMELLLIYDKGLTEEGQLSLQKIVKLLTFMQHSVTFVDEAESLNTIGRYKYVVCYDLHSCSDELIESLAQNDVKVFMIGGSILERYMKAKGYKLKTRFINQIIYTASYEYKTGELIEALIDLSSVYIINSPTSYNKGRMEAYGERTTLYKGFGDLLYTPLADIMQPLSEVAFSNEAALWLWPYKGNPNIQIQYIIIEGLYPFFPAEQLLDIVDYLEELSLPYIISVMPIYQNGDYPAMKRFCEVLRYAQANNGSVIMKAPITFYNTDDKELIWEYLTTATEAYMNYGIYPLAIELPEEYMFSQTGRDVYRRYSTVFWFDTETNEAAINLQEQINLMYYDGHKMVGKAIYNNDLGRFTTGFHSTAIYIDAYDELDSIKKQIEIIMKSELPMKSLLETDNTVYTNSTKIQSSGGLILVDDKAVSKEYEPFVYEDFDYHKGILNKIVLDIGGVSRNLLILVCSASVVFVLLLIMGRTALKKRFRINK